MKLIVGLGNPGNEYINTRHNIGFSFLDFYLQSRNITPSWSNKFDGLIYKDKIYGEDVLFLKPQTYMNLSGNSVYKTMNYYHISIDDILIICDDLDLNIGNFKLKLNGSSGGHNGLKDIENKIHSSGYKRLKIGISNNKEIETKDYVLGKLSSSEKDIIHNVYSELCNVLNDYFHLDFTDLMSKYNHKNR